MYKKTKKKTTATVFFRVINIGYILTFFSFVYRFCFFVAPKSPLYILIQSISKIGFGVIGTHVAFVLMGIFGLMMIGSIISSHRRIPKGIIIMICVSAILNFPLIDNHTTSGIQQLGGYSSRPLIQFLFILFGSNPFAIKVMLIIIDCIIFVIFSKGLGFSMIGNLGTMKIRPKQGNTKIDTEKKKIKYQEPEHINNKPIFSVFTNRRKSSSISKTSPSNTISGLYTKNSSTLSSTVGSSAIGSTKKSDHFMDIPTLTSKILKTIKEKTTSNGEYIKSSQTNIKTGAIAFGMKKSPIDFNISKPIFPLSLLEKPNKQVGGYDEQQVVEKAQLIINKLKEFDIIIDFVSCDVGPSIVQLRFQPQAGVKLSKIESYKDDIQYVLRVKTIRIVAPIPGTDAIGIQIPNPTPRMVRLSEVLGSNQFVEESHKSQTNLTIGVDVENTTIIKTLESMPHLLVAGATGSGKSVGVNDFILSLLYQNTPTELRFIMIDPKQVELEMYDGLPYLLAPVITTADKALKALKRSVEQMESRYSKLKSVKLKHISEYNDAYPQDTMSRIVIIIDELADLMLSGNKKEIETYIVRIAQKARAVGMHLITATQRPSVNVITGLIKANIPTRIAFGVAQLVDSRTILDQKGAENLVGKGDLLYIDASIRHPLRIQAPFVSTEEITRIVGYIKSKTIKDDIKEDDLYDAELFNILTSTGGIAGPHRGGDTGDSDDEILLEQAIDIITTEKKASTTMLQRKLSIGFARAGRLMDTLEQRGIVGPQEGSKSREILV